jgi:hypothetical protein
VKIKLGLVFVGLIIACLLSFLRPGAYDHYRFYTHGYLKKQETEAVKGTVKLFSSRISGFYSTGFVAGINTFPAEKMVKRRIFQDIRNWEESNRLLVMDRDKSTFKQIIFYAPDTASAEVDENWFVVFQDRLSRQYISAKKGNILTVRYYLKKKWGRWIIIEYDVYNQGDKLPPVPVERVLKWE